MSDEIKSNENSPLRTAVVAIIGRPSAGKSTFLKILSGEIESTTGSVIVPKDERISVLVQNHLLVQYRNRNLRLQKEEHLAKCLEKFVCSLLY